MRRVHQRDQPETTLTGGAHRKAGAGSALGPLTANEETNMALLGIILTVTGVLAVVITLVRGPNLGLSRRTGYITGGVLLVLGVALLIYSTR
jgi:hypothetical protein